jgi:murein DD-endopeptidase MepM/ murein hydrolase activator NlpD
VTIYKNLAKDLAEGIQVGATVKQGQQLGIVGDTAVVEMADEPHLHFEVTVKGLSVDPLEYFSEQDVEVLSKDPAVESGTADSMPSETRPDGK